MPVDRSNRFGSAKKQAYRIGDIVFMKKQKCEATVLGSIRDLVPTSRETKFFKVRFESGEEGAWYHANEMELVEKLEQW